MRKYIWLSLGVVALIALGFVIQRHIDRETQALIQHAQSVSKLLSQGKAAAVYAKTLPAFRKAHSLQAFRARIRPFFKLRLFRPREVHVMFSRGTVRAQVKGAGGRTFRVTMMFKKKDKKRWLAAFLWKEDVAGVAGLFFDAIQKGANKKAYSYLSTALKAKLSEAAFARLVATHRLRDVREYRWFAASQTPKRGALSGILVRKSGATLPCAMMFRKEHDLWMLQTLRFPKS